MSTKKNIILDATLLTSLMTCPRLTDFRFTMNLKSIKGNANSLECGSIVHRFLETYYLSIVKGLDKSKAFGFGMMAAELYIKGCKDCTDFIPHPSSDGVMIDKPLCGHRVNDYEGVKNTPPKSEAYKTGWEWVLTTCEQYNEHYKNDSWVPLEVEIVKSKVLFEDDEIRVMWKAKLDLTCDTNQGIFPVDHKTMKQRRTTNSLNNQFIGQCLLQGTQNVIINKIGFQTTLKPSEKFERAVVSYSNPRLIEWQNETLPFYSKLLLMYTEAGYFPPNYNNCEGKFGPCPFKGICESDPEMREENLKQEFIVGLQWNPMNEDGSD